MDPDITDGLLEELAREWAATLPSRFPLEPEHPHRFSRQFLDKMELLFREADRREDAARCRRGSAGKLLALLLAAALATTMATAFLAYYFRMVREERKEYSAVHYEQVGRGYAPEEFVPYHVTYVPEGFTRVQSRQTKVSYKEKYTNGSDDVIYLRQSLIARENFSIDTERVALVEVEMNNKQQALYLDNDTIKALYWDNGEYSFRLTGNLEKDELFKIAESVLPE